MLTKPKHRDKSKVAAQPLLPAGFSVEDAVSYSGLQRWRLYEEIGAGKIEARKSGRRTIIVGDSLREYLANLPRADIRMSRKAA